MTGVVTPCLCSDTVISRNGMLTCMSLCIFSYSSHRAPRIMNGSSSGSAVLLIATGRERIAGAFTTALRDMVEAIKTRGGAAPEAAAAA